MGDQPSGESPNAFASDQAQRGGFAKNPPVEPAPESEQDAEWSEMPNPPELKKLRSWSGAKQKRSTRKKRFEKYTSGVGLQKLTLVEQADKGIGTRVRSYNCAVVAVLLCLLFVGCAAVTYFTVSVYNDRAQPQVTKSLHGEPLKPTLF